jgi:hypothetical protein
MPERTALRHVTEDSDHVILSLAHSIGSVIGHTHTVIGGDYTALLYATWATVAQSV